MSARELVWRMRQMAAPHLTCYETALPGKALSVRQTLPPVMDQWPIQYFDVKYAWTGDKINWQGQVPRKEKALPPSHRINYRNTSVSGDPKVIWELNRHQFLHEWVNSPTRSKGEQANAVSHLLLLWIETNPYGRGINWCSALEAGLRLISWQSAMEVLTAGSFDPAVLEIVHGSVSEHARYLRANPSLYSSANNHRVGELTGEIAAAALFPNDHHLTTEGARAWNELQKEAQLQVASDGFDREQAVYYHAYVLLYMRRAAEYASALSYDIPGWFQEKLLRMQAALDIFTANNGSWFEIGDRDDGNLSALQNWSHANREISSTCPPGFHVLPESGYTVWKEEDIHLLFRCGPFGYPAIAAHAHCDQLSVLLKMDDREILTDSGSYCYHDNVFWRQYFRGTTAHNTVRVDNEEQARSGGSFLWRSAAEGVLKQTSRSKVVGETNAWYSAKSPLIHQRTLLVEETQRNFLRVEDEVLPGNQLKDKHSFELIWNFGPGVTLAPAVSDTVNNDFLGFYVLLDALPALELQIRSDCPVQYMIYFGDESVPAGWHSRRFGQKIPITQLRVQASGTGWKVSSHFNRVQVY